MIELPTDIWDDMARRDFVTFVARVMAVLEPGTLYEDNWHIELMAQRLLAVQAGDTKRLMINLPPRSMKTIITSIAFVAWLLGHDPTRRIICVTYSQEVAKAQTVLFTGRAVLRRYRGTLLNDQSVGSEILYNSLTEVFTVKGGDTSKTAANPTGRVRAMLTPIPEEEKNGPAAPATDPATLRPSGKITEPKK